MNIAIKLPNDLRERVLAFPLIHMLVDKINEKLVEDEILKIHLISLAQDIDVLNLLPFEAFYHELEESDIKSVFSVHRACANFKISNIDFFISTTDSFVDASIGKNIGAKENIGFAVGKNGWMLSHKITKMAGDHKANQMYRLIKGILGEVPPMQNVEARVLPPLYDDYKEEPYMVINLDLIDGEVNSEWLDLVDLLVGKKFIFFCTEIGLADQQEFLEEYIKTLPRTNTYKFFVFESNIHFAKLISYAVGFITHDTPLLNVASYCRCEVLLINRKENLTVFGPKDFSGEVHNYSSSDPAFGSGLTHHYGKVFDEVIKFIESHA